MKTIILFLIAILSFNINAQNWGTPVNIERLSGTAGDVGHNTSMRVVNGNPAIAYYDNTHGTLMYMRAMDAAGTTWANPIAIDSDGVVGNYPSLEIVNGNPAISYFDETNGDLKYARATDIDGASWGTPVSVDVSSGIQGKYTSLKVVNGFPAIAYIGASYKLRYVQATDANGMAWGTSILVDLTMLIVGYITLEVVNGNPAIAYCSSNSNYSINYIRATNVNGTAWGFRVTIGSTNTNQGRFASLKIVNGNPAVAFYSELGSNLKYARANDVSGTTWATPISVVTTTTVGQYTSLQIVNGNPAISYYDFTNGNLKYVRATNASGTAWAAAVSVDITDNIGQYTSMQIVNGNPAISYYDVTNMNLKYVSATDALGTTWAAPISFDENGDVGTYNSTQIVNGYPAVSYYDVSKSHLKFVRASNAAGTAWDLPVTVDVSNVGYYTSLQVVNGNPAISYYDLNNTNLKYVRANDAVGGSWSIPVSVDVVGNTGWYTSLQMVNGNPAIAYYDQTNDDLKYVRATDALGTIWGTPISIDVTGSTGLYTSLQIINGNPAISYYDQTNGDLKYVRSNDANGSSWGTPVFVDSVGDAGRYTALQTVNGNPAISYYDFTNNALKYVRANDVLGTTWGSPMTLDATTFPFVCATSSSLQIINGIPAISYLSRGLVKYIQATNASGTAWSIPVKLDSMGGANTEYTSMIPIGTGAGIVYYNRDKAFPYFIAGIGPCSNPTVPTISATNVTICSGDTTTLSITAGTLNDATDWRWYSNTCGGTLEGSGTSINVTPTSTTTYYARGEGGCVTASICASVTVAVNNPTNHSISSTACDSYTLNAQTYTTSGVHTQILTNAIGCDSVLTINLTINNASNHSISPTTCDSYTLNSQTYTTSGTYLQTLTNALGCDSVLTINLTIDTVDVSTTLSGATITATTAGAVYQWLDCNNGNALISGATNQTFTATANGDYAVVITNNGCTDTSACVNILSLGINQLNETGISIYPNPFSTQINLIFDKYQINTVIKIIDILGKEIDSVNFTGRHFVINKAEMGNGLYFIQIIDEQENILTKKIIKN